MTSNKIRERIDRWLEKDWHELVAMMVPDEDGVVLADSLPSERISLNAIRRD